MTQVFISHATEDWELIQRELKPLLEANGLSTWSSHTNIPGGSEWEHTIRSGLEQSEWFLLAMSPNSVQSKWVAREVHWAMEERFDHFVPVLLQPCETSQLHLGIRQLQIVDLTEMTDAAKQRLLSVFGVDGSGDYSMSHPSYPTPETVWATGTSGNTRIDVVSAIQPLLTPFQYFCYISESKVNQLVAQIPTDEPGEALKDATLARRIATLMGQIAIKRMQDSGDVTELHRELSRLQTIRNLGSLSFGTRTGNDSVRKAAGLENAQSLVTKTRLVLRHLMDQNRVESLEEAVRDKGRLGSFCYFFNGEHRVHDYVGDGIVIISSRVGDYQLHLYCSMKYFSDMGFSRDSDGKWRAEPHSLNVAFFQKDGSAYSFITFLLVTSLRDRVILGSPICLILDSNKGIPL